MGRSKVELFAPHVVAAAGTVFDDVVAVQRYGGEALAGVTTIFEEPHPDEAPLFGVVRALADAASRGERHAFVLAVDYPHITPAVLAYLRERVERSAALLVAPRWDDKLQMLCAGYDVALRPRLDARIAAGRLDLRGLVDDVETELIDEAELRARFEGEPLRNVNRPEELEG